MQAQYMEVLLLRAINPKFVEHGMATWRAFQPLKGQKGFLSVQNGSDKRNIADKKAKEMFKNRIKRTNNSGKKTKVYGILAVTVAECLEARVCPHIEGVRIGKHVSIDYSEHMEDDNDIDNPDVLDISTKLAKKANERGWIYTP